MIITSDSTTWTIMTLEADGYPGPLVAESWSDELNDSAGARLPRRRRPPDRRGDPPPGRRLPDPLRVIVAPARRGQGIARKRSSPRSSWLRHRAVRILLEVEEENLPPGRVRPSGLAPIDRRRDYYGPDRHAIVMGSPSTDSPTRQLRRGGGLVALHSCSASVDCRDRGRPRTRPGCSPTRSPRRSTCTFRRRRAQVASRARLEAMRRPWACLRRRRRRPQRDRRHRRHRRTVWCRRSSSGWRPRALAIPEQACTASTTWSGT